jgi:CBS domain-containing protein
MPESAIDSMAAPLARVLRRQPVACGPEERVSNAVATMRSQAIGSMIVVDAASAPIGILTLRDVVDRVALEPGALDAPIEQVMTPHPVTLPVQETAYAAALAMIRHGVRHIVLVDGKRLAGLVSERDLFGMQSAGVRHLSTEIRGAKDLSAVTRFGADIRDLACRMVVQGAAVGPLTAFIASLNDLLTERIVELDFRAAATRGLRWCWVVMGSEGRSEQTLRTDQDNGLIFDPAPGQSVADARAALLPVAQHINQALDQAGYRLCPGDIMAGNPQWCLSLDEWRSRFAHWIDSGSPEALLHGAIFFDLRPLAGEVALGRELRDWLAVHAPRNRRFLHQMARNALENRAPLRWPGGFRTAADGRIDLKLNGAGLFVDAARIFSLAFGIDECNTERRLRAAAPRLKVPAAELEAWIAAFHYVQGQRLRRQAECLAQGLAPDNRIDPRALNDFDRDVLRSALGRTRALQRRVALDYQV